jgi:predicted lipid carrier protein YhbT
VKLDSDTKTHRLSQYHDYFETFLPSILGKVLIEGLKSLNCQVAIEVTDTDDMPWILVVQKGRLVHFGHTGPEPICRYLLDLETLIDVISARCTPQDAFFETRIHIEGDIEQGLQLSTVLEEFFERYPYDR